MYMKKWIYFQVPVRNRGMSRVTCCGWSALWPVGGAQSTSDLLRGRCSMWTHTHTGRINIAFVIVMYQPSSCAPGFALFRSHSCGVHTEEFMWREQHASIIPGNDLWANPTSGQHRGSSRLQNFPEQTHTWHALLLLRRAVRNNIQWCTLFRIEQILKDKFNNSGDYWTLCTAGKV